MWLGLFRIQRQNSYDHPMMHKLTLFGNVAAKAPSKSAMMSPIASRPTDTRIISSETPATIKSSLLSCAWIVLAGWITKVLASPTFVKWLASLKLSISLCSGFAAALGTKAKHSTKDSRAQELSGKFVRWMQLQAEIRYP